MEAAKLAVVLASDGHHGCWRICRESGADDHDADPWHTGRVVYIPFIAFALALGMFAETVSQRSRLAGATVAVLAAVLAVWSPLALRAEVNAMTFQVKTNFGRAQSFREILGPDATNGKAVIVVEATWMETLNARFLESTSLA